LNGTLKEMDSIAAANRLLVRIMYQTTTAVAPAVAAQTIIAIGVRSALQSAQQRYPV
jgi:hypothetical protein